MGTGEYGGYSPRNLETLRNIVMMVGWVCSYRKGDNKCLENTGAGTAWLTENVAG